MRWLWIGTVVLAAGCGGGVAELRDDVKALRDKLDDIARSSTATRSRIDEVESRVLLLQDEMETQKIASMRGGGRAAQAPVPQLPTVRVVPPTVVQRPARVTAAADDDDADREPWHPTAEMRPEVLDEAPYQEVDEMGRLVPQHGARAKAAPAAQHDPRSKPPRIAGRASAAAPDDAAALGEYRSAYALYEQGRIDDAKKALGSFATKYPRHPYADNAQYWVGECFYDQKDYESARREFMRVVSDHPDGNKVPDSMVKVGLCNQMLNRTEEARRMFDAVMLTYPDSQAAAVALKLLGEIP